jgi:hypothetical protein
VNESFGILKTFLKLTARNFGEDLFFKGFRSVLGILFEGGLKLALGNFAIMISFAELIGILTNSGYKAYKEINKTKISGTLYNVHTTADGVLVAENPSVVSLKKLPIQLPEKASFSIHDIFDKNQQGLLYSSINNVSFRQLDSKEVFKSLTNMRGEGERYYCNECAQIVTITAKGSQIGHAPFCSKNNNRYTEWCNECGRDLRTQRHSATCHRAIIESLRNKPKDK